MSQASVYQFLKRYKRSSKYKKKKWLSVKEIFDEIRNTEHSSAISSITVSIKRLRETNMIICKDIRLSEKGRIIKHYRIG